MSDTKTRLREVAEQNRLHVAEWSPGDGATRYRFILSSDTPDYHGASHPLYTALGLKESWSWLRGYMAGAERERREK